MKLVVTQAFGDHAVGDELTEGQAVEAALAEHPHAVVKVGDHAEPEAPADDA